ncbi:hypothetical protein Q2T52_02145 [Rhizobium oryzicola]|uniref:Uncharacterized protein n=1 Tax=Rhizobium oryzicola TaxID=1232668 RepID=A0ABT8SR26_9HYPH|nr:hypothetical protein [Rhizobium oryzicola]MDO1580887.1 hypothetical protein [Rhizobium oryzicola]
MDAEKVRFIAVDLLGAFETLDREDATYHAMLGLSDILLHVADDPVAVDLVSRIEDMIDRECGVGKPDASELIDGEVPPLVSL